MATKYQYGNIEKISNRRSDVLEFLKGCKAATTAEVSIALNISYKEAESDLMYLRRIHPNVTGHAGICYVWADDDEEPDNGMRPETRELSYKILTYIKKNKCVTREDISTALGVCKDTISDHLGYLQAIDKNVLVYLGRRGCICYFDETEILPCLRDIRFDVAIRYKKIYDVIRNSNGIQGKYLSKVPGTYKYDFRRAVPILIKAGLVKRSYDRVLVAVRE